ncbi:hypothetical protein KAU33_06690 [Candidatus Dependentiae bacterium]|nr:hypothetical protein [Candidatus Dependentiae bacterium]
MSFHLKEDENLLYHVKANLYRGIEGVGGDFRVTDKRVLFHPHALNVQKDPEEIDLPDIVAIVKKNTLGIFPNGIFMKLKDGRELHFVVNKRDRIINLINHHIKG